MLTNHAYTANTRTTEGTARQTLVASVYLVDKRLHPYPIFSNESWYTGYAKS